MTTTAWHRVPFLALGAVAMVTGLAAGEARLGWSLPGATLAHVHGVLMVSAFFGTVIGLERAVAIGHRWAYAAPLSSGLGGLATIAGAPVAGAALLVLAAALFGAVNAVAAHRQPALFTVVLLCGGLSWLVGGLAWLATFDATAAVPWWAGFLILTIAGERLELSRFLKPGRWRVPSAAVVMGLVLAAPLAGVIGPAVMWPLWGAALMLLTVWMLVNDVARRTIGQPGLTRYVAVCLFAGYAWLGIAGVTALLLPVGAGGMVYDAVLHAVFVGFVFSMVFGHAPVILPAVLRVKVPFLRLYYLPLALLHLGLALRVAGDLGGLPEWREWGGLLNGVVIVLWIVTTAAATIVATRRRAAEQARTRPAPADAS